MKKHVQVLSIVSIFILSACIGEENPLTKISPEILAQDIYETKTWKNDCNKLWANPKSVSKDGFAYKACEDVASDIAIALKEKGYGEIKAEHVKIPAIWKLMPEVIDKNWKAKLERQRAEREKRMQELKNRNKN
ncbi:MAG: hypothetical protein AAF228_12280 [Pseudomonadota bacterium]